MNTTRQINEEPIGAIVKEVDNTFTKIVRRTSQGDFNRIEWQFLNFVHERNSVAIKELINFLMFFESERNIEMLINRFEQNGFVSISEDVIMITARGKDVFKEALEAQERIKEKFMEGIQEIDYITTVRTIKKIVSNLSDFMPDYSGNIDKEGSTHVDDKARIRELIQTMEQAHNNKDPELFTSLFAADAVFVNAMGVRLKGKENIYQAVRNVMRSTLSKSYAHYELFDIRFIEEHIAIADINQHPITAAGDPLPDQQGGMPTLVLMKSRGDGWKIVSGQNTLVIKMQRQEE